jgi:hypothetical protein
VCVLIVRKWACSWYLNLYFALLKSKDYQIKAFSVTQEKMGLIKQKDYQASKI